MIIGQDFQKNSIYKVNLLLCMYGSFFQIYILWLFHGTVFFRKHFFFKIHLRFLQQQKNCNLYFKSLFDPLADP